MTEKINNLIKYGLPIASFALSILITVGGWLVASKVQNALLGERLANLQRDAAKHETEKSEQIRVNALRTEEHEKRIVRLEANFSLIQETLSDMKNDIKILLRGQNK